MVRAARRRAGLSQRGLAGRAGLALGTVTGVESGRVQPGFATVVTLLAAAGLDLTPGVTGLDPPIALRGYLTWATTERLRHALRDENPERTATADRRLAALARVAPVAAGSARVALTGPAALGLWLPDHRAPWPVAVQVWPVPARPMPESEGVVVTVADGPFPVGCVPVAVGPASRLWCPTPLELLLDPRCAAWGTELRAVLEVLHSDVGRDDAQRRPPPHRDPDERAERERVMSTHAYGRVARPVPDPRRSRAWRAGAPASARQWLREKGYPDIGWRQR